MPVGRSTPGADTTKEEVEKSFDKDPTKPGVVRTVKRRWYGKRVVVEEKRFPHADDKAELEYGPEKRPAMLYAPLYNGIAAGLSLGESSPFRIVSLRLA